MPKVASPKLRVLLFTHAISRHADDHPQFINELALAYQHAGHAVKIVTASHRSINPKYLDKKLDIIRYRYALKKWEQLGYGESLDADLTLNKATYLFAPMIMLSGMFTLWQTIRRFRPDFVHVHWALPNGPMAALATFPSNTPFLISFPGSDVTVMGANPLLTAIGRFACHRAAVLTTNSHDLRDTVVGYGVEKEKIQFVIYGSDRTIHKPDANMLNTIRARLSLAPNIPTILSVGRMVPKKGFRYLIEAASLLAHHHILFHLILIGDGEQRNELQSLSKKRGIGDKVIFAGRIAYRDLPAWYQLTDIFAMPAVREPADGLNVVVVEAMKYSLPIVATDVGGNELVIEDGFNGRLCPQKNAAALADALRMMIEQPQAATEMGHQAHKTFLKQASWDSIVEQYVTLITPHLNRAKLTLP